MDKRETLLMWGVSVTGLVAWVLANGLDVVSALLMVRLGSAFSFARYHRAEFFLNYTGMRLLGTLAVWLLVALVNKHWPSVSRVAWSTLTACALVTAIAAWWRLAQ